VGEIAGNLEVPPPGGFAQSGLSGKLNGQAHNACACLHILSVVWKKYKNQISKVVIGNGDGTYKWFVGSDLRFDVQWENG
jgi:hypothetical protein